MTSTGKANNLESDRERAKNQNKNVNRRKIKRRNLKRRRWLSITASQDGNVDIKYGNRNAVVTPAEVDSLGTGSDTHSITTHLSGGNVEISSLQETHIERGSMIETNIEYIYCSARRDRLPKKEISRQEENKRRGEIAIEVNYIPIVYFINRVNIRIAEVRLKSGDVVKNLSILNKYAPRAQYAHEDVEE